jgi:class 3 adenylate cyclase
MSEASGRPEMDPKLAELVRLGVIYYVAGGILTILVGAIAWLSSAGVAENFDPPQLVASGAVALFFGFLIRAFRHRFTWPAAHVLSAGGTLLAGAIVFFFAQPPNFGPMVLLWAVMLAYAFFPLPAAIAHTALVLLVLAFLFVFQPGWEPPLLYWVFTAGTILVTVLTIVGLVRREQQAREELAAVNRTLEQRVDEQVETIGRMERLRRFLSPSVAEAVLSAEGEDDWLAPHRREIAVVFCDLRGFTAFSATAEPEDVTALLGRFHQSIGELVDRYEATVGGFAGDGVFLYFNDPVPCPDPAERAVRLSLDLARPMAALGGEWKARGHEIGYGVGIALGFATLGISGFSSRREYTALGTVVNLAARLSDEATSSAILLDPRAWAAVRDSFPTEPVGELTLKGFAAPVPTFRVVASGSAKTEAG